MIASHLLLIDYSTLSGTDYHRGREWVNNCYRQSNVRRLFPASDCCRARGNQIVEHSSDNETVKGSCRKLGGEADCWIGASEKRICRLRF